ncbi:MAG: histidinol-phosphate transaminase [Candidatus Marinimicrobia bacterium]|nr:histidinol-phosphate transaminase [Candidatus Neomarinimicrobiota bacterium]
MNINITSLVRKNILKMKKYASARDEFTGKAKVFLDANENAFGSPSGQELNRYPDPLQKQLRDKIADYKGLSSPEHLFLGNGSDEAIDLILRAFCEPRIDSLMLLLPTYGMYSVSANVNDIKILNVELNKDFSLNVNEIISVAKKEQPKVIFICSPNNPSANVYAKEDIEKILNSVNCLVMIDEAYIDFATTSSWIERLDEFKNLIVIQTFSKAWGMAGVRLGMAFADPEIINVLNKIKYPYNINDVTSNIVLKTLQDPSIKDELVTKIKIERTFLMNAFKDISIVKEVIPSEANFFLARFKDPDAVYRFLTEEGIIVRNRSNQLHCEGCLRVTVGTREENIMLCEALQKYSEKE